MPRKHLLLLLGMGVIMLVVIAVTQISDLRFLERNQSADIVKLGSNFHNSGFFELKKPAKDQLQQTKDASRKENGFTQIGLTSHHLPTALTFISDFYKKIWSSQGPRKTFVILGPDHFERCYAPVSTTKQPYQTPFGKIYPNEGIISELTKQGVVNVDEDCLDGEHSIGVQTIFIRYLYPEAKIVPLVLSSATSEATLHQVADLLTKYKDEIIIVTSVDFSHSVPYEEAKRIDAASEEMIEDMSASSFNLKYVDSPPAVKLTFYLAQNLGLSEPVILGRANSSEYTSQTDNTTGYINVVFTKR